MLVGISERYWVLFMLRILQPIDLCFAPFNVKMRLA